MSLQAHLGVDRGSFRLEVEVDAEPGAVLAVLGSNGAGKSTLLDAVAGTTPIDDGRLTLGGRVLDSVADSGRRRWVPPHQRGVGVVPQDVLLFPHLSVADNIGFGLQSAGRTRADARAAASEWLERLGMADRADDRPASLSGGQAQRVALARALAIDPDAPHRYGIDEVHVTCPKAADEGHATLLDVCYDWDRVPVPKSLGYFEHRWMTKGEHGAGALDFSGVWRFRELLPFYRSNDDIVTVGEGRTNLQDARLLAQEVGMKPGNLFLQYEGLNPSGSFKDNGMTAAFTHANLVGAQRVACRGIRVHEQRGISVAPVFVAFMRQAHGGQA